MFGPRFSFVSLSLSHFVDWQPSDGGNASGMSVCLKVIVFGLAVHDAMRDRFMRGSSRSILSKACEETCKMPAKGPSGLEKRGQQPIVIIIKSADQVVEVMTFDNVINRKQRSSFN